MSTELNNAGTAEQLREPVSGKPKKKKKIAVRVILILLAVIVLLFAGGYTYWVIRGNNLVLPYDLEPGLNLVEAHEKLLNRGFHTRDYSDTLQQYTYDVKSHLDIRPDFVILEVHRGETRLTFFFKDDTDNRAGKAAEEGAVPEVWNSDRPSPQFNHLLERMTEIYGSPSEEEVNGHKLYEWSGIHMNFDFYSFTISYIDDNSFTVKYSGRKGLL